ncbi:sulfurtransferase TusA family protein [Thiohalophilus sp.]|uniref:sulfurtransferase TusA family protein n=1 Tax=Thiohalophilus sp. TaxID=3028392 RepID=UPI002ACE6840|nr:sulfurtransferase TusA family protein [Thiohalophilus sp.]MDZ7661121.1 sulfurtransferase TusA family protein [Thiohalophilus sp.]MDZ7803232.1 sulfurtransferase TusA family protein [Thiohalophilus sp.]
MAAYDQELDAKGLTCPLLVLRAKKSIAQMASGQVLHIEATDPGAVKDFEAFARQTGHELQESREESGTFYFVIQKA